MNFTKLEEESHVRNHQTLISANNDFRDIKPKEVFRQKVELIEHKTRV